MAQAGMQAYQYFRGGEKSMTAKRVHFSCDEQVYEKLESLRHLLGKKREEIIEQAIIDRFKEVITNLAASEGLLGKSPIITLNRSDFDGESNSGLFDEICDKLSLKGEDGQISSIRGIRLEVKTSSVIDR